MQATTPRTFVLSLYGILGVPWNAGEGAIRAAFHTAAKTHHPDLNDGDPQQHAAYDRGLRRDRRRNARHFLRTALAASGLAVAAAVALTLWLVRPPRSPEALAPSPQGETTTAQPAASPAKERDASAPTSDQVPDLARGQERAQAPDPDRALADLDRAIREGFSNAAAYDARGLLWLAKGQRDRAIADFTRAIELDPRLVSAYLHRAAALHGKGDVAAAAADLERAAHLPD